MAKWKVENEGMGWEECETAFLRSRKLGIYGAARAVRPRTIEEYKWDLHFFFDFMKARHRSDYNDMTRDDVLDYIAHLQSNGWSPATQRKYLISLRAFFRWVELDPDCQAAHMQTFSDAMPRIGREVRRTFIPSPEQMKIFMDGFDRSIVWGLRDYTATCLMLETGARVGEVCNLELSDVKWDVSLINLDGKTGERLVPFSKETFGRVLQHWLRVRPRHAHKDCKAVFISRFGGRCTPDLFRQSFADNLVKTKLDVALGKDTISCHTIRHYYCTYYLVNGGRMHNLQRITGHKVLETLMIYVHMANQITTVAKELERVSPLGAILEKEKKRTTLRL